MNKLKIGIVDVGNLGSVYAKYIIKVEIPNAELTDVCRINS
ncbi:hypothetical protein [Thermoanaerobacter mathranii]